MGFFDRIWDTVAEQLFGSSASSQDRSTESARAQEQAQNVAPVIWLIGKTGAGKTSIIAALTGDERAKVGSGFEPCTSTASVYDLPRDAPAIRFLDTRGLEEANYDPGEDIAWCEGQAHLLLVVMSVADPDQASVVDMLCQVRARHPAWPLIVAQTHLHAYYAAGQGHPTAYPFTGGPADLTDLHHPHPQRQALAYQRSLFVRLSGAVPRFVPVDITHPDDGFTPPEFGLDALEQSIAEAVPEAKEALRRANADSEAELIRSRARPLVLGYAAVAGGAGAVPVPMVGLSGLGSAVALMLRALAGRYGVPWTPALFAQFTGAIGGGTLLWWGATYGLRELVKLIPVAGTLIGGSLNAAAAFGVTVGIGEAACVWLGYLRAGSQAPDDEIRKAFADGLVRGFRPDGPADGDRAV